MGRNKNHRKRGGFLFVFFMREILILFAWALTDSNRRPSACKADALNQLS